MIAGGQVDLQELQDTIREDTILVSMMYVNNELGTVIPVDKIGALIKAKNKDTIFHVDAIQAFGKMVIYPKKWNIDLLSISGHKFHGPKGIGVLYINDRIKMNPISYGGNQQKGIRNGTENVPGIAAIGCAAQMMYDHLEAHRTHLYELKSYLAKVLVEEIEGIQINGMEILEGAPHILSVRIADVRGEVLLHSLEDKNIYVSTGSACASNKPSKTGPLQAIGLTNEEALSTVRFGFSVMNTKEELAICVKELKVMVPMLRKFVRH